jgi:hypothetical protein
MAFSQTRLWQSIPGALPSSLYPSRPSIWRGGAITKAWNGVLLKIVEIVILTLIISGLYANPC